MDLHPAGGLYNMVYTLNLQVWRPSPTVENSGCYSLVGNNQFTSVSLFNQVATVTPLPQERIEFQPGDVLGFSLENTDRNVGGVVTLIDSSDQGNYEIEEVWYADMSNPVIGHRDCPYPVGSQPGRVLNTFTNAAPVISVSYGKLIPACFCHVHNYKSTQGLINYQIVSTLVAGTTSCPPGIAPTTTPPASPQPISPESLSAPPATNPSQVTDPMVNQAEETINSDSASFIGLITGITVTALLVVIIITLTLVLGFLVSMKFKKHRKNEGAYGSGLQDTDIHTYDDLTMDDQAIDSINIAKNEAYATINIEAKSNDAYAMSIPTERNEAYGTTIHQDTAVYTAESDTYDYL